MSFFYLLPDAGGAGILTQALTISAERLKKECAIAAGLNAVTVSSSPATVRVSNSAKSVSISQNKFEVKK